MGDPYCELWFKPRDDQGAKAMKAADYEVGRPGVWVRLWERGPDEDRMGTLGWDKLSPDDVGAHGESVYMAVADGGTFAYEHIVNGKVSRALVFAPSDDGTMKWQRVEGSPEKWESSMKAGGKTLAQAAKGQTAPAFAEEKLQRAVFDSVLQPQ